MTGIQRLRELAGGIDPRSVWSVTCEEYNNAHGLDIEHKGGQLRDLLADIADQIDREQEALVRETEDVAGRDGDALAWVEEHGGLGAVKKMAAITLDVYQRLVDGNAGLEMLETDADTIDAMMAEIDEAIVKRGKERTTALALLDESVPRVTYERHIIKRQRQIDESHAALRRRNEELKRFENANATLLQRGAEMKRRLMPEGMEWPRYESGEFVKFGDELEHYEQGHRFRVDVVEFMGNGWRACYENDGVRDVYRPGERVKRPAPKVLDADGVEIRMGDRVWSTHLDEPHEWIVIDPHEDRDDSQTVLVSIGDRTGRARPEDLTHRAPVLAADGKPLREGEHVYHVETGAELVVKELPKPGEYQAVVVFAPPASHLTSFDPDQLTHERPDSWERWREEWQWPPVKYCKLILGVEYDHDTQLQESLDAQGEDLVRRARALAGSDR